MTHHSGNAKCLIIVHTRLCCNCHPELDVSMSFPRAFSGVYVGPEWQGSKATKLSYRFVIIFSFFPRRTPHDLKHEQLTVHSVFLCKLMFLIVLHGKMPTLYNLRPNLEVLVRVHSSTSSIHKGTPNHIKNHHI